MSISQALNNATSGLSATSRQANIAAQNIANALTPGYSRREVSLSERILAGEGAGVRTAGIDRANNPALSAERRAAGAAYAGLDAQAAAAEKLARLVGGPEDPHSLFQMASNFDQALRSLADSPASAAAQQAAVSAAATLASKVRNVADAYQQVRVEADREIEISVEAVNSDLKLLEELNDGIAKATAGGRDASALLDQRDSALDRINSIIPIRPLIRENGRIDIMTQEGVMLFSGAARTVEFAGSPIINAGMTLAGGSLSGLTVDGVDITPGAAARSPAQGKLAGLFAVRDVDAVRAANELDLWTEDLISRFQDPAIDPTLAVGDAGLFTVDGVALAPPPATGLASRLQLNNAVDPVNGGATWRLRDGIGAAAPGPAASDVLLRDLISAFEKPQASALNAGRLFSALEGMGELSANAGGRYAQSVAQSDAANEFHELLREAELAETGVDTDAELQQLLIIEQAYAANAKMIEAIGQMIDRLMEI